MRSRPAPRAADTPGLGKPIAEADIKPWDISILADGTNLPPGSGTAAQGAKLFVDKGCNQCHGDGGKGGIANMLVGSPSLTEPGIYGEQDHRQFLGPDPPTLFDYIRRAMPWPSAAYAQRRRGLFAVPAYLLAANKLIAEDQAMDAKTLPQVKMPNRDNFIIKFPDRI